LCAMRKEDGSLIVQDQERSVSFLIVHVS